MPSTDKSGLPEWQLMDTGASLLGVGKRPTSGLGGMPELRHGGIAFLDIEADATRRYDVKGQYPLGPQVIYLPRRNTITGSNSLLIGKLHKAPSHGVLWRA